MRGLHGRLSVRGRLFSTSRGGVCVASMAATGSNCAVALSSKGAVILRGKVSNAGKGRVAGVSTGNSRVAFDFDSNARVALTVGGSSMGRVYLPDCLCVLSSAEGSVFVRPFVGE